MQGDLKEVIDSFVRQNVEVATFVDELGDKYESPDQAMMPFIKFLKEARYNPALATYFIELLLLANDEKLIDTYSLTDISGLFQSVLRIQEYNVETYIAAATFEWAVMDDRTKAQSIAREGLAKARQKIRELAELAMAIETDS